MKNKKLPRISICYELEKIFHVPVLRTLTPHEFWCLRVGLATAPVLHEHDRRSLELAMVWRK